MLAQENPQWLVTAILSWRAIYMPPLSIVEVLESKEDTPTPENVSKPSKEQSDQILSCSTSLVSVNTSLALERV